MLDAKKAIAVLKGLETSTHVAFKRGKDAPLADSEQLHSLFGDGMWELLLVLQDNAGGNVRIVVCMLCHDFVPASPVEFLKDLYVQVGVAKKWPQISEDAVMGDISTLELDGITVVDGAITALDLNSCQQLQSKSSSNCMTRTTC